MNKNNEHEKQLQGYISPLCDVIGLGIDDMFLAESPIVQPGGGGSGNISMEDLKEDDEDTDISGAKRFGGWEYEW